MTLAAGQDQNTLQGDFGEAWLEAVAAGCGLLHGRPTTLDLEKADVELTLMGEVDGVWNPTVKVQVKTASGLRRNSNGDFSYDLDIPTYDVLRRDVQSVRRILAVIEVAPFGERIRLEENGTMLVGRGAWVSLESQPSSPNGTTQAVTLPVINTLDQPGLERMLKTYGIRRTTIVPNVDVWGET